MRRSTICGLVLSAFAALAGACGGTTTTPTPTPTLVTDTLSNTLAPNGAYTHQIAVSAAGVITATLTTVSPDSTVAIGFDMGTYSTLTSTCQVVLSNTAALQGAILTGNAQTAGTFCVRVYDVGRVTADAPVTYTVTVTHP